MLFEILVMVFNAFCAVHLVVAMACLELITRADRVTTMLWYVFALMQSLSFVIFICIRF